MEFELRKHDVNLLQQLASAAGLGAERVAALQRRSQLGPETRQGAPYVLLFGNASSIRLMLAAVAGPELAARVQDSQAPIVVIGRRASVVTPLVTAWPNIESSFLDCDGVLVLKAAPPIPEGTLAALASLGTIELGVLATRLAPAITQDEVALARSLAGIIECVRVAIVGFSGEDAPADEVGELAARARDKMREAGFGGARYDRAAIWRGGQANGGLPAEVERASELLFVDPNVFGRQRDAALAASLGRLLDGIEKRLADAAAPPGTPMSENDIGNYIRRFDRHIEDLGRRLKQSVENGDIGASEQASAFLRHSVEGWISGQGLEATDLRQAEASRPGLKALLAKAAESAGDDLNVELPRPTPQPQPANEAMKELRAFLAYFARNRWTRLAVAVAFALLTLVAAKVLLPEPAEEAWIYRYGAVGLGILGGFVVYYLSGQAWVPAAPTPDEKAQAFAALKGWPSVEKRLNSTISKHLRNQSDVATKQSIASLRERLVKPWVSA